MGGVAGSAADGGAAPAGYVAGMGRGLGDRPVPKEDQPSAGGPKEGDLNDTNYDQFSGYGGALFHDTPYEEDDAVPKYRGDQKIFARF